MEIAIQHQVEKTFHTFQVQDPDNLSLEEVIMICQEMDVHSLFINGRIYKTE